MGGPIAALGRRFRSTTARATDQHEGSMIFAPSLSVSITPTPHQCPPIPITNSAGDPPASTRNNWADDAQDEQKGESHELQHPGKGHE